MSYILPSLLLFAPALVWAEEPQSYCEEIAAVLQDSVRSGQLTYREAGAIMGRCFEVDEW